MAEICQENGSSLTELISDAAAEDVRLNSPHKSCILSLHPESSRDADAESAVVPGRHHQRSNGSFFSPPM